MYGKHFIEPIVAFTSNQRKHFYPRLIIFVSVALHDYNLINAKGGIDGFANAVGADFLVFYNGARFYLEGMQGKLYDFSEQSKLQQNPAGLIVAEGASKSLVARVNSPFALINYLRAYLHRMSAGLVCFSSLLYVQRRAWLAACDIPFGNLALYTASFFSVILWLLYFQATAVLLLLLALSLLLLRKPRLVSTRHDSTLLATIQTHTQISNRRVLAYIKQRDSRRADTPPPTTITTNKPICCCTACGFPMLPSYIMI